MHSLNSQSFHFLFAGHNTYMTFVAFTIVVKAERNDTSCHKRSLGVMMVSVSSMAADAEPARLAHKSVSGPAGVPFESK